MKLNGKTRIVVLLALVVVLASSNALLLMQLAKKKKDFEAFLRAREAVASVLKEKFAKRSGGGGTTTLDFSGPGAILSLYPTSDKMRETARGREWHHCWNFVGHLSKGRLALSGQEKTIPWRANKMSDWLLSDLSKAGFSRAIGCWADDSAQEVWWTEDFSIYVISEIAVDIETDAARLSLTIIESF